MSSSVADMDVCVETAQTDPSRLGDCKGSPVYLDGLKPRAGSRPKTNSCLPHSQLTDTAPLRVWESLKARLFSEFPGTEGPKRSLVSLPDSLALTVAAGAPFVERNSLIGPEFAHLHGSRDGSLHIRLTDADARELLVKGWGELHLMAGPRGLPTGLVMVYAPRDEEEVSIIMSIITASYKFVRGEAPLRVVT